MKNLQNGFTIFLIIGSIVLLSFVWMKSKPHVTAKGVSKGFAVVELFTSEGCSSCPPADAAIATLLNKHIDKTYILSFHVDYWNRLGWKDVFSKQEYSARQQDYARSLSLQGVYTPQVIVNGTNEFVGSDENSLNKFISNGINNGSESNIKITAIRKNNFIEIHYDITGDQTLLLNSAIILPEATTQVKRGENGGRTLHHVNIVKEFKVSEAKGSGDLRMEISNELIEKPLKIIVYTQTKQNLKILGADEVDL
ncbi:MAG: DUF1223 domain-containing protein [Chitinophagaceae bacterium]|nr:DUF1223 domain-containing protein [Chitinophagaceae bacterium]